MEGSVMDDLYPASPINAPADLARPSRRYRIQVAVAVLGVTVFLSLYFGLAAWLCRAAYRGLRGDMGPKGFFVALPAAFVALVLLKSLVALRRRRLDGLVEVTASSEPRLVAFVHRIADEVGAKRPKRIYLSDSVNAAVFFDVGFWNLIIPTKKNLELGLGLINVLSLDELKAVVAHEFGHFAQRSMGVGSWVYLAQSLVGDLITRRDILDKGLDFLSRIDLRVAWVGWLMRLIVWSLRALVEHAFRVLLRINRLLSQQMEFQADLVSVRAAGSDSLVHALHRLGAADEAWMRAANFTAGQALNGKRVLDLFSVQTRILERHAEVHDIPEYGQTPALPERDRETHRVFKPGLGETPKMWSTHPPNHEREANCKATYIPSTLDPRSAWALFDDAPKLRAEVTRSFVAHVREREGKQGEPATRSLEETLADVDESYARPHLQRCYQGLYTLPEITRMRREPSELVTPCDATGEDLLARLGALYPASLVEHIDAVDDFRVEKASLEALHDGFLEAPGGLILHRGRQLRRKDLPATILEVSNEWELRREEVLAEFAAARGVHLAIARAVHPAAEAYLESLLALLHYAEHSHAEMRDAMDHFDHVLGIVLADGNVSSSEMTRLCGAGEIVSDVVAKLYAGRLEVSVPSPVLELLKLESWAGAMPERFGLFSPGRESFADGWIEAARSWSDMLEGLFQALARRTLDSLLDSEAYLAECFRNGTPCDDPPPPAQVPAHYTRFPIGAELPRQKRLGWWDRFQVADGPLASALRLGVASAVFAPALLLTAQGGTSDVVIHNGLERTVHVQVGAQHVVLGPHEHDEVELEMGPVRFATTTAEGASVESFQEELDRGTGYYVYNVAEADGIYEYTVTYGNVAEREPVLMGSARFQHVSANHVFTEPPTQISTRRHSQGGTRSVIEALPRELVPRTRLSNIPEEEHTRVATAHARWDTLDAEFLGSWLQEIGDATLRGELLALRLEEAPRDVRLLRMAVNEPSSGVSCDDVRSWSQAAPDDPDLLYLGLRCGAASPDEWVAAYARFPQHAWIAWATANVLAARRQTPESVEALATALPVVTRFNEVDAPMYAARLLRLAATDAATGLLDSQRGQIPWLDAELRYDEGLAVEGYIPPINQAAAAIEAGRYDEALANPELGPEELARVKRLISASLDAPPAVLAETLQQPTPADPTDAFIALGIALREGADAAALLAHVQTLVADPALVAQLDAAALRADPASLDALLVNANLADQMHLRLAAAIVLGENAPEAWVTDIQRFFFAAGRPRLRR